MEPKEYSLVDFRKCTREAFNAVDGEIEVVIERFGKKYILTSKSYYDYLHSNQAALDTVEEIKAGQKYCKHGSAIGLCKHGCKK